MTKNRSVLHHIFQNLDVTSIISQRLNAMRKLQDNPHDVEAIKLMHTAQKDVSAAFVCKCLFRNQFHVYMTCMLCRFFLQMSSWANSKFVPGQFTGSTGANILSSRELTSGLQAWAKRVSFIRTAV